MEKRTPSPTIINLVYKSQRRFLNYQPHQLWPEFSTVTIRNRPNHPIPVQGFTIDCNHVMPYLRHSRLWSGRAFIPKGYKTIRKYFEEGQDLLYGRYFQARQRTLQTALLHTCLHYQRHCYQTVSTAIRPFDLP